MGKKKLRTTARARTRIDKAKSGSGKDKGEDSKRQRSLRMTKAKVTNPVRTRVTNLLRARAASRSYPCIVGSLVARPRRIKIGSILPSTVKTHRVDPSPVKNPPVYEYTVRCGFLPA